MKEAEEAGLKLGMTMTEKHTRRANRLKAVIVPAALLTPDDQAIMFELMREYYQAITAREFLADLSRKDSVVLLKDAAGAIRGFSTVAAFRVNLDGQPFCAVFSGDTVIDRRYWGERALGKAFLRRLFAEKIKSPFEPLYWLLISKGYKTYLMMANNFAEHYPRFEKPTPSRAKSILDSCYSTLYPETYDSSRGVIVSGGGASRDRKSVV